MYAYDIPDREDHWPNLREAANVGWRGLTTRIADSPYLVIDRDDDGMYVLENPEGDVRREAFFDWGMATDQDKLVAATRMEGSPLREVGTLAYDEETGWSVVTEDGQVYPIVSAVQALEDNAWFKRARISGSFTNEMTGENVDFHELDHYHSDPSTGDPEYWEIQGDDGEKYQIVGNEVLDNVGNVVGHFDPLVDPDPDRQEDRDTEFYPDWEGPDHQASIEKEAGTYVGGTVGCPGVGSGTAICPERDKEFADQVLAEFGEVKPGERNVPQFQEVPTGDQPSTENPSGQIKYNPGFVLVSQWATPDFAPYMLHPRCRGIVTGAGGSTSHAVLVARQRGIPCVVDVREWNEIQDGQTVQVNGTDGHVFVAGGGGSIGPVQKGEAAPTGLYGFVWSKGNHMIQPMPPNNADNSIHYAMMEQLDAKGQFDYNDSAFGVIYDNGKADIMGQPTDLDELKHWLEGEGATSFNQMQTFGSTNNDGKAKKCPNCGSHTIRLHRVEDDSKGHARCLTCGKEFTIPGVLKNPDPGKMAASKFTPGTRVQITKPGYSGKGSILESSGKDSNFDEELYDILLDSGEKMEKVPESAFKRIKSAGEETTDAFFIDSMSDENPNPEFSGYSLDHAEAMKKEAPGKEHMKGVSPKRNRQYEHVLQSCKESHPEWELDRCKEYAARTVNKTRAEHGETKDSAAPSDSMPFSTRSCPVCHNNDLVYEGHSDLHGEDMFYCPKCGNGLWTYPGSDKYNPANLLDRGEHIDPEQYDLDESRRRNYIGNTGVGDENSPTTLDSYPQTGIHPFTGEPFSTPWTSDPNFLVINPSWKPGQGNPTIIEPYMGNLYQLTDTETGYPVAKGARPQIEKLQREHMGRDGIHESMAPGTDIDWQRDFSPSNPTHQMTCPKCGGEVTANNDTEDAPGECNNCGEVYDPYEMHELKQKSGAVSTLQGEPLKPGHWYTMYGQNYKVPDVIHILNADENRVEAAIQGDDKGHFPIVLTPEEIESKGYTFEPYDGGPKTSNWQRVARKQYTTKQQLELINENPEGRARNMDKMNLEGTHYVPRDRGIVDDLSFLW